LSASGLAAADVKTYIVSELTGEARKFAKRDVGLSAARLAQLQEGLAKLQAEGVLEGLKAAKAAKAQRRAAERRQAAKPPPPKRRRTSTGEPAGGGGGGGGGGAMVLGSRFQVGADDQAAEL
jgi:hypothetical protein